MKGNSYKEDLINEQAWAAIGWSGDILPINAEQGDRWGPALPESGGTLWIDTGTRRATRPAPRHSSPTTTGPDVAARVAAWVYDA